MNQPGTPDPKASHSVFAGDSEMAALMRSRDWSESDLGPVETWSPMLKTMVRTLLANRFPLLLWWGPKYIQLYNDAYRPIPGAKHPGSMGQPGSECWPEIWHILGPLVDTPFRGGPSTWMEDILLQINRHGYMEETHYTIAYSPVPDESAPGGIGGVLATVHEITEKVIGERRMMALRDLGTRPAEAKTVEEACSVAAKTLSAHDKDVPFALLYLLESNGKQARLVAAAGTSPDESISPTLVELGAEDAGPWPFVEALKAEAAQVVSDLGSRIRSVPRGPWSDPPDTAVVLPLRSSRAHEMAGFLVAGVSARLRLDDAYRGFLELAAAQVATAISNAQALEAEKRRADALAELDRAKSVFFSNVSHEFRTPLTLMLSPLEEILAKPESEDSKDDRDLVVVAHRNARRLLKLVNALLDFSRIEAGRTQLSMEPMDLAVFTAELASCFRSAMDKAGLGFHVSCSPLSSPVYVDREAWEKVVLNLLSNAFKFTLQGSVSASLHEESGHAVLTVTDTGIGIPESELPNICKRFHRIEGARGRTHEGTGIGLSLVQELVRLHGGTIRVESREGEGSTFRVFIPLGSLHVAPEAIAVKPRPATWSRQSLILDEVKGWLPEGASPADKRSSPEAATAGRIVLAEDNADMREYLRRLLHDDGYIVDAVADGRAALGALERRRPDLLLTDVMMPVMDGFALLKAVRSHPTLNDVAVVLLSARAGEESKVEGLDAGADDYLVKPFSATELMARVRANINIARLRRAAGERERDLRKDAEAERDRLRAVLSGIRDYFSVLDQDWKFAFVSDAWSKLTGLSSDEVIGKTVWELFPAVKGTDWERAARRVMETREYATFEYSYQPYDMWLDVRMAPWPGGGISQFSLDITERKKAEAERNQLLDSERAARAEADRATRMKDEFLATLSHELRTPLNAIVGWTHLLKANPSDSDVVAKGVEVIERNTLLQTQLICDLLDMNRIINGKMRLDVQLVDLPTVLNAVVESFMFAAQAKGVRLQTIIEPLAELVHGDAARIQQIVWNLLSNAIKFTPRGGRVQIVLARVNSHVEITVSDTGQGIHPEFLPQLFERFRQADAGAARQHGGLGIGLALVKQLTELHGGRVRARSDGEGKGATFVVELPLAILTRGDEGPRQHPRAPQLWRSSSPVPNLSKLSVLLVDDEPDALDMIQRVLQECGVSVFAVPTAEVATRVLKESAFDLIVSDVGMPKTDGYEFIAEVRRRGIKTPALALTAFARTEDKTKALLAGYQAHVAKPVDVAELLATMAVLAGRDSRTTDGPGG